MLAEERRRIVVGLGNPGDEYVGTRHNVGFGVADRLSERLGVPFRTRGGIVAVADGRGASEPFLLLKPLTYMNLSGIPLRKVLEDLGGMPEDLVVVLDDFNLELGRLRIRGAGSDGGHNGLRSILSTLKTQQVARLRLGVGPPPPRMPMEVFVLRRFSPAEVKEAEQMQERAAEAAKEWIGGADLESLMNRYNPQ
ncbi:MAG: aminoacyl-tRNA hydrolase [Planctomycetota bacterium]